MNKICVVTGTRAEYGLLSGLIKKLSIDNAYELQVIVTNMHLSPIHGSTVRELEREGIGIDKKIEILLSSDTPAGVVKSTGLGFIGFADALEELKPELLIVLGDRYEILAAAASALLFRIPIAHISGGEVTQGAYDDAIRHAVTKMSNIHFTQHETYRKRVIQLGENPEYCFNVGSLSIDNILNTPLMSKGELEKSLGFTFGKKNLLVTYHPETTGDSGNSLRSFKNLTDELGKLKNTNIVFTYPNSDDGGFEIIRIINEFVKNNESSAKAYNSLGYKRYLSAMKYVDAVVGNSSSGIVEAPSFRIGTINIGNRQQGRLRAESIIDCDTDKKSIHAAFEKLYSNAFKKRLKKVKNPFGDGKAAERIYRILNQLEFDELNTVKEFYDLA